MNIHLSALSESTREIINSAARIYQVGEKIEVFFCQCDLSYDKYYIGNFTYGR